MYSTNFPAIHGNAPVLPPMKYESAFKSQTANKNAILINCLQVSF